MADGDNDAVPLTHDPAMDGEGSPTEGQTEKKDEAPPAEPTAQGTSALDALSGKKRGPPKLSEEEKARRALERATRKAQSAGVADEIIKKYDAVNKELGTTPAGTPPVKKFVPTAKQVEKAEKAIAKSASFIGSMVYEFFSVEPTIEFPESKAKDLGEAWGELAAEYIGENAGTIIPVATAIGATGYIVMSSVKEIKDHNRKQRDDVKVPDAKVEIKAPETKVETPAKVKVPKGGGTWEVVIVFAVIVVAIIAIWYFTKEKKEAPKK